MGEPRIIELTEYVPRFFDRDYIPESVGIALCDNYENQVAVEFPTHKTDNKWQLAAQGWVGYIPLTPQLHIALRPKVPLENLFKMLEYAYSVDIKFQKNLFRCRSLEEFYERLANVLAKRVLDRSSKGLYRAYIPETERLPYMRGRLDVNDMLRKPWQTNLKCHYEEHTADIEENQILAWTLFCIARSGVCRKPVLVTIRRAYLSLQGFATLVLCTPQTCIGRLYNRLNDDYQPLHALCRFFLEHAGPTHEMGAKKMLPFLVDMAALYERFVAEWVKSNLPQGFLLRSQDKVRIGKEGRIHFSIDLVLYDASTGKARYVLDTKYKAPSSPSNEDISQVVTYAEAKGCKEAILIYPTPLETPLDERIGEIRVRSLAFSLDSNLEEAGQTFMEGLIPKNPL